MDDIKYLDIKDKKLSRAVQKAYDDYKFKLHLLPSTFTGKHHPKDERDAGGIIKHIEKVCWFIIQYKKEFLVDDDTIDLLLTAAFFHDLGSVDSTRVDLTLNVDIETHKIRRDYTLYRNHTEYKQHPRISAMLARKYLSAEKVDEKTIDVIYNIIERHMSHFYDKFPQPVTELERIFALADYIMSRSKISVEF